MADIIEDRWLIGMVVSTLIKKDLGLKAIA